MRILVKRDAAFGDVCNIIPVLRKLRRENPDAVIDVLTKHPLALSGNQDINMAGSVWPEGYNRVIDLNGAYEKLLRKVHPIDAYMTVAFGKPGPNCEKNTYIPPVPVPELGINLKKAVAIHPTRTWPNRTLKLEFWEMLAFKLIKRGFIPVVMGTRQDHAILVQGCIDTRDKMTAQQQCSFIDACCCFVSSESGLEFGIVPATDTPVVSLVTMSTREVGSLYRHDELGWKQRIVWAKVPCVGCQTRITDPAAAYVGCERGDFGCITTFEPDEVVQAIVEMSLLKE